MRFAFLCGLVALAGCELHDGCPCPDDYVCCEAQGTCVLRGQSCEAPPSQAPEPTPPTPASDDRSDWICCGSVCTPPGVPCDGWDFTPVGFDSVDEFRAVLEQRWIGVRHVPWTPHYAVWAEFQRDVYRTECQFEPCASFYWGVDLPDGWLPYRFTALGFDGSLEGYTTVTFGPSTDDWREGRAIWSINATRDRLRIQLTKSWTDPATAPATLYLVSDPGQGGAP